MAVAGLTVAATVAALPVAAGLSESTALMAAPARLPIIAVLAALLAMAALAIAALAGLAIAGLTGLTVATLTGLAVAGLPVAAALLSVLAVTVLALTLLAQAMLALAVLAMPLALGAAMLRSATFVVTSIHRIHPFLQRFRRPFLLLRTP